MRSLRDTIFELMSVPEEECDLDWLKQSLQAAIKLEFSTLPPYLCAFWSIDSRTPAQKANNDPPVPPTGEVADAIKAQISIEEMLHMGLACNLLVALDQSPILNTSDGVPIYPGKLPGNVNPNLTVSLQGLSKKSLLDFLSIEQPQFPPLASPEFTFGLEVREENDNSFPTISDFYDYILRTFKKLNPTLKTDRQIEFAFRFQGNTPPNIPKDFSSTILKNLDDIETALQIIKKQGEGSHISPADDGNRDNPLEDLAHYYRFAEIYKGKKLALVNKELKFEGADIPFPDVFPMAKVPPGGYQEDQVRAEVRVEVIQALKDFDEKFTQMMNYLQEAWTKDPNALGNAVGSMFSLRESAQKLMSIPILADESSGNFGPCFRLVILP
jgi:hypothetical protein